MTNLLIISLVIGLVSLTGTALICLSIKRSMRAIPLAYNSWNDLFRCCTCGSLFARATDALDHCEKGCGVLMGKYATTIDYERVEVDFDYTPAHRAYINAYGLGEYPDEEADVEITWSTVPLTKEQQEQIEQEILNNIERGRYE